VHVTVRRVDAAHGDTLAAWQKMGSPHYLTQAQIAALKQASQIGKPEVSSLHGNQLTLTVPPKGLAVAEIR
jgi:xylan 1,4-beta-xylosidase